MRNHSEANQNETSGEIAALEKKFRDLEAQLSDLRTATTVTYRRGFSRGMMLGFVPFMALLFFIGSMLHAGSAGDALFIDPRAGSASARLVRGASWTSRLARIPMASPIPRRWRFPGTRAVIVIGCAPGPPVAVRRATRSIFMSTVQPPPTARKDREKAACM